jgi:hypothetical protein
VRHSPKGASLVKLAAMAVPAFALAIFMGVTSFAVTAPGALNPANMSLTRCLHPMMRRYTRY